jgi:hypothetical protein
MPASDQIKDWEDSTEIARQQENLPEVYLPQVRFPQASKVLLPTEPGPSQAAL